MDKIDWNKMFTPGVVPPTPQFHPTDKQHFSNWCRACGLYYCWHDDAPEHARDPRAQGHKFEPRKYKCDSPEFRKAARAAGMMEEELDDTDT